eukprot:g18809.t1
MERAFVHMISFDVLVSFGEWERKAKELLRGILPLPADVSRSTEGEVAEHALDCRPPACSMAVPVGEALSRSGDGAEAALAGGGGCGRAALGFDKLDCDRL